MNIQQCFAGAVRDRDPFEYRGHGPLLYIMVLFILMCITATAQAAIVTSDLNQLSTGRWQQVITVENNVLAMDIEEFSIYYDYSTYSNITVGVSTPAGWDPLIIDPIPALTLDGFYDALALASGIAPGDTLGQFRIHFDYSGAGGPENQSFDIIDPDDFSVLESGTVTTSSIAYFLPVSSSLSLLFFLSGLYLCRGSARI